MKNYTLSLLVVLLFASPSQSSALENGDSLFREALIHEQALDIFTAIDKNRDAVRLSPANTGYLEHYAWLLHNHEYYEDAAAAFSSLRSKNANDQTILKGMAWDERKIGRKEHSLKLYSEVYSVPFSEMNPAWAYAEIDRLNRVEQEGNVKSLLLQLQGSPDNKDLSLKLFQSYIYMGELEKALSLAGQILGSSAATPAFRLSYAKVLSWSGNAREAENVLQGLTIDFPNNPYLYYELGKLQIALDQPAEAEQSLKKSLSIYSRSNKIAKALSEALALQSKNSEAVAIADSIPGDSLDARLARAQSRHFTGNMEAAIPIYERVLSDYPDNLEALSGLTECYIYTGRYDNARKLIARWKSTGEPDSRIAKMDRLLSEVASPEIKLLTGYYSNSSRFRRFDAGVYATYRFDGGSSLSAGYAYSRFSQSRFSPVTRNSATTAAQYVLGSSLRIDGEVDFHSYDNNHDHVNGGATITFTPVKTTEVSTGFRHFDIIDTEPIFGNPIYSYVTAIGAVGKGITSNDYTLQLRQDITDEISLWGRATYGDYSDSNEKQVYLFEADYRPSSVRKLMLFYNLFYLDYRHPAPNYVESGATDSAYYDPRDFIVHTAGVEYKIPLFSPFSASIRQAVSHLIKNDGLSSTTIASLSAKIGKFGELGLDGRLFYQNRGINRYSDSGHFRAESILLTYRLAF